MRASEVIFALERDVASTVDGLRSRGVNDGGAILLSPATGEVLAWVGGVQAGDGGRGLDMVSEFPHQPGSTLKPLLFACALARGALKPDEKLDDTQRFIGGTYFANWDLTSRGVRPAAVELAECRNTAAAELRRRLTPEGLAACLRESFHVQTDLHPAQHGVELGLGLAETPMLELAAANTALANGGVWVEPSPVLRIQTPRGEDLYRPPEDGRRSVLDCSTAAWVTRALFATSRALGIEQRVASKTGTTSSSSYAVGYSANIVLATWVGRTEPGRGLLAIDDVAGREGGGAIWRALVSRRAAAGALGAFSAQSTQCPG